MTGLGIYDMTAWGLLTTAGKEFRLLLAAKLMTSLFSYIGWPVYKNQALPFPRRIPKGDYATQVRSMIAWDSWWGYGGDIFFPASMSGGTGLWTWPEDDPIVIPDDIKIAQACIAYAVIHKRLVQQSNPADGPEDSLDVSSMSYGGLSMSASTGSPVRLDGTTLEAVIRSEHSHIYLLLEAYITRIVCSPGPRGPALLPEVP